VEETALLDSGATENFINHATVTRLRLGTKKLNFQRPVYNIDGTMNKHGTITHACDLMVKQGNKKVRQCFYVSNLGKDRFILGYPWFRAFNPDINWANAELRGPGIKMETIQHEVMEKARNYAQKLRAHLVAKVECHPWSGVTLVEILGGLVEIKCTHNAIKMAHKYDQEHGKEEVKLPEQFKHHENLFSDKEANTFPPGRGEGDHKIELLEIAPKSFNCKVYPLSQGEWEAEDKFINENLAKGYIVPSNSPYGFSTFMVPKKDSKKKQYIINYRPLNAVTRKDVTPLPNLGQCIKDLQGMEIFSKFDIWWGYNNIRICKEDKWKGAFKTQQGLFEPKVMFFGMSNLPTSFQQFVNMQIMEEFCQKFGELGRRSLKNYMDDFGLGTLLKDIDLHI